MKNNLQKLTLLILLFFIARFTFASHVVGGDISYACGSTPGTYKVTIKLYRDCAGVNFCQGCSNQIPNGSAVGCTLGGTGGTAQIIGKSPSCSGVVLGNLNNLQAINTTSGYDIIQTCKSVKTICTNCNTRQPGTFAPGIEVYTYEGTINLNSSPANCCEVAINYSVCCRNNAITNFIPGQFYMEPIINRCITPCNSSPIFSSDPVSLVCAGQEANFNLGAIDPDGDSLSYAFGESLVASGQAVTYNMPYNANYPFNYLGAPNPASPAPAGLRINPLTGDISFVPLGVFVTNLVVEVKQWKLISGIYTNVGVTRRDIQFQTISCPSNLQPPKILVYKDGVKQSDTAGYNFSACAGKEICLDVVAEDRWDYSDQNPSNWIYADTTDLTWNNPGNVNTFMSNATWTRNYILAQRGTQGPKNDSFKFCWTPPTSAVRSIAHSFNVNARDRFCPINSMSIKGINIKVIGVPRATLISEDNKCGNTTFKFLLLNPSQVTLDGSKSLWQIENKPGSDTSVTTATALNVSPFYTKRFTTPGNYKYKLKLNTIPYSGLPLGCPYLDSGTFTITQQIKVTLRDTFRCIGTPVTVKGVATGGNRPANQTGYQFFLGTLANKVSIKGNINPLLGAITTDSFLTIAPTNIGGIATYTVMGRDQDGCIDSSEFKVETKALPLRELSPKIRLCEGQDTSLFVGANGGIGVISQFWYKAPNLTTILDSSQTRFFTNVKFSDSATYVLKKTDVFGCTVFDTTRLLVNKPVDFIAPFDSACQTSLWGGTIHIHLGQE